jgi:hypothetical protein
LIARRGVTTCTFADAQSLLSGVIRNDCP